MYLTYEALKRIIRELASIYNVNSLYLTYEGLKHVNKLTFVHFPVGLYLTYEGLKPFFYRYTFFRGINKVCILPMRD